MGAILLAFIDSDYTASLIVAALLLGLGLFSLLLDPSRRRSIPLRYAMAILRVIAVVMLLTNATALLPIEILKARVTGFPLAGGIALATASLVLGLRLAIQSREPSGKVIVWFTELPRLELLDVVHTLASLAPIGAVAVARILLLGVSFSPPVFEVVWSSAIIIPLVEEYSFRYLLPRLARERDCGIGDYVFFSLLFFLLHVQASNFGPFFFSFYAYVIVKMTGKFQIAAICHAAWNLSLLSFPYVAK